MSSELEQDAEMSRVEFKAACDQLNSLAVACMLASLVPNRCAQQHKALRMAANHLNDFATHFHEICRLAGLDVKFVKSVD